MSITCKASKVVAVVARHIIPSVTMLGTKGVHTVLVFPIVWLMWSPEPKVVYFFVRPNVRALHASIIESNQGAKKNGR